MNFTLSDLVGEHQKREQRNKPDDAGLVAAIEIGKDRGEGSVGEDRGKHDQRECEELVTAVTPEDRHRNENERERGENDPELDGGERVFRQGAAGLKAV